MGVGKEMIVMVRREKTVTTATKWNCDRRKYCDVSVLCINRKVHEIKWLVDKLPIGGSRSDEKYECSDNESIHTRKWSIWKMSWKFIPEKFLL